MANDETKVSGYEAAASECERLAEECSVRARESSADGAAAYWGGRACSYIAAARIIREHAQPAPVVREVGEAEAEALFVAYETPLAAKSPVLVARMARALRAAGLCVAVTDTEWAALVAERDGLLKWLDESEESREAAELACGDLREQRAAATKRAEEAEREVARWRDAFRGNPPEACRANYDALTEGLTAAQNARDAAEARVRELGAAATRDTADYQRVVEERDRAEARLGQVAARPVVDAGARKALEAIADAVRKVAWAMPKEHLRDVPRADVMRLVEDARAALNGEG